MSHSLSSYLQEGQQQVHLKQIEKKKNFSYLKMTQRKGNCTYPMRLIAMPAFRIFLFRNNFSADNNSFLKMDKYSFSTYYGFIFLIA